MKKIIDLHTHSCCSDGSMTPAELVIHAKEAGLSALALSDHDTTLGIDEALSVSQSVGIELIPAIELSASSFTDTHILGYFIDHNSTVLKNELQKSLEFRAQRSAETEKKLRALGFDISTEEAFEFAGTHIVGRAHFAAVMVKKGYVESIKRAFELYLANGRPAYSSHQYFTPSKAIEVIHAAGGIAFCAHLNQMKLDDDRLFSYLCTMKEYGLDGIEGYYTEYTDEMGEKYRSMAKELGLILSGGSDFHAEMKPHISIGKGYGNLSIDYSVLETMKKQKGFT